MNKLIKILLAILAGLEVTFYLFTPILISTLWMSVFGIENIGSKLIFGLGLLATLFRAIKVGWLK